MEKPHLPIPILETVSKTIQKLNFNLLLLLHPKIRWEKAEKTQTDVE